MTNPFGKQDVDLVIADTKTGKTFSLMKGYMIRSFDIAPNGEHVAVTVYLGSETPAAQQPVFALYVLPLSEKLSEASPTKIEPFVRKIRMGYGITVSWSPDSRYIAYTTEGDLASGDALVVNVETGVVRNLTENLDVNLGREYKPPLWIGKSEALLCIARGQIWKVPLNEGTIRNLSENFEFSVHDVFYPSEGYTPWTVENAITIKVYDHKRSCHSYYRLSLTDNTVTLLREEDKHRAVDAGRFYQDVAEETGEFVYVVESNQEPQNIWMSDTNFESPQQITDVNPHLQTIDFGKNELIEWTLEDGQTIKGILVLPSEASEENPAPVIVNVYAGSMPSHYVNQFSFADSVGYFHTGMFVSRGYALFLPDFPVQKIEPYKQFSDIILPGVDAAIATKKVDAERLGVIGHSFGGYTVNVLITQTTRFKAAVAIASMGNLISGFLNKPDTGWYETGQAGMGGPLWEFPQRYIDGSPVFHLDRVETPLLLIHGDQDFVPFEQAKEMFMGLARLEKEVVLLKYKEADHAPDFWSNEKLTDYWERVLNWFDEYLK
jgi:dipeptidyl aminopeptidase/acylaminoacyl peptidase